MTKRFGYVLFRAGPLVSSRSEATAADATAPFHHSASICVDRIRTAAVATFFHRSTFTPTTRSHRQSDPSRTSAGSWIQGTRSAANPGARRFAKL